MQRIIHRTLHTLIRHGVMIGIVCYLRTKVLIHSVRDRTLSNKRAGKPCYSRTKHSFEDIKRERRQKATPYYWRYRPFNGDCSYRPELGSRFGSLFGNYHFRTRCVRHATVIYCLIEMIVEFRIPLPIAVSDFEVAQLYMITRVQENVTGGGEGVVVLKNEAYGWGIRNEA